MHRAASVAIAAFLSVLGAGAALANVPITVFGLKFPPEVGGFSYNDSTDFERSNPGQGYVADYTSPGWKLEVYIYDLKRREIPADPKSAIVRAEFERSRSDAFLSAPRGPYAQVYLRRNFTIENGGKQTRFQCAAFHMTRDGAKPQDGVMCLTSWRNKFIKYKLTTLARPGTEAEARQHVAAWNGVLWSGPNAAAAAPARAERPRRASPPRRAAPRRAAPARRPFQCPPGYICR